MIHSFRQLQECLRAELRVRLGRGEMTERQLARQTGISQPHLHHLVKGVRELTPAMADRILSALELRLFEIADPETKPRGEPIEIAVLSRRAGPGTAWPVEESRFERLTVSRALVTGMLQPFGVRLEGDSLMEGVFRAGEMVIGDRLECADQPLDPEELHLVKVDNGLAARWVRTGRSRLYLLSRFTLDRPREWFGAPLAELSSRVVARLRLLKSPERDAAAPPRLPPRDISPAPRLSWIAS